MVSPRTRYCPPRHNIYLSDSHTCSLGALGALAWGLDQVNASMRSNKYIGQEKPKSMLININGIPKDGVTAKDIILHLISKHGANGANGHAIEFQGETIDRMSIESRLTLCNMAVEFGAMTGIISPDKKTIEYISGKAFAPEKGDQKLAKSTGQA